MFSYRVYGREVLDLKKFITSWAIKFYHKQNQWTGLGPTVHRLQVGDRNQRRPYHL